MSTEKNNFVTISSPTHKPRLVYDNANIKLKFIGGLLNQDKVTYSHEPIINIYIVYRLISSAKNSGVTLENCLFGAVKLTKCIDIDKYKYSGYSIRFDSSGNFSHTSGEFGKNVIIFGVDMSSSVHANNNTRDVLVLGKDFIQG